MGELSDKDLNVKDDGSTGGHWREALQPGTFAGVSPRRLDHRT
jgi:hypothetical protein